MRNLEQYLPAGRRARSERCTPAERCPTSDQRPPACGHPSLEGSSRQRPPKGAVPRESSRNEIQLPAADALGSPLERGGRRPGCVRTSTLFLALALLSLVHPAPLAAAAAAAAQPPAATSPSPSAPAGDLYLLGKQLFEDYAPPEIKAQYEFPSKSDWDAFGLRLQSALEGDSLSELADVLPQARLTLRALKSVPGYEDYADWLEQKIDEVEAADAITRALSPTVPPPRPPPSRPPGTPPPAPPPPKTTPPAAGTALAIPHYAMWQARVKDRPLPARAANLMPRLRAAFTAEGVPAELAWLAEAESSLNPAARSPVGAKGLFQFMPETAKSLGLDTFLPDDRTDPEKSAHAAARYLRMLHGRFGDWPLALAAYNAGEGRVSRALAKQSTKNFAAIAGSLPAETRMYVPKVCALVAFRSGVVPEKIAAPRAR